MRASAAFAVLVALIASPGLLGVLGTDGHGGAADEPPGPPPVIQVVPVETLDGTLIDVHVGHVPGSTPTRLVVFGHGYQNTIAGAWLGHMLRTIRPDTAVVAPDYRDDQMFPALKGAEDIIAATLYARARFPQVETTYLFGVSMGGATSGIAIAEATMRAPAGMVLFDHWIDVEGVSMITETWAEAKLFGHPAAGFIEHDAGGTPVEVPHEYVRRSAALRAQEMRTAGLQSAIVIHSVNDGTVPYDQGREMAKALLTAGIPTLMFTVGRVADDQSTGTTGTGAILGALGQPDEPNQGTLHLAGHAWEGDAHHPVMRTAFERLEAMLDGEQRPFTYGEHVVDDQL